MDQVLGRPGGTDADDRRQRLVVDHDAVRGVLGEVAVGGHHHGDRLADVVDLPAGQGVLRPGMREVGVGISNGSGSARRPGKSSQV